MEAQHMPGIVAAITDRRNTAGLLLLEMLFDHRLQKAALRRIVIDDQDLGHTAVNSPYSETEIGMEEDYEWKRTT